MSERKRVRVCERECVCAIFCRDCGDCFHTFCFDHTIRIPQVCVRERKSVCERECVRESVCVIESMCERESACGDCFHTFCFDHTLKIPEVSPLKPPLGFQG